MSTQGLYYPENAGSGQYCNCAKCGLPPTPEGHDGCLGTLPGPIMNACCGHGNDSQAYIQYWESEAGGERVIINGEDAVKEISRLTEDPGR